MYVPPTSHEIPPPESVFVYGRDPVAIVTLAVGLAVRRHGSFSWADCSVSDSETTRETRTTLGRGTARRSGDGIGVPELRVPHWPAGTIDRLLVPEARMDRLRLMSYLALPRLLQELAAMSTAPSGESCVVLTNIDALEEELRVSVFGSADVHRRLYETKVSLVVTGRNGPGPVERTLFDRVLRVEVPPNVNWSEGTVLVEKDRGSASNGSPMPVRVAWRSLGLDPTLLPSP